MSRLLRPLAAVAVLLYCIVTSAHGSMFVFVLQDDAPAVEQPAGEDEPVDPENKTPRSPSDLKIEPKPEPMEGSDGGGGDAVVGEAGHTAATIIYAPCPSACYPVVECQPVCPQPCYSPCPTTCKPQKRCRLFGR